MTDVFVSLPARGIIHVEGQDRHKFLQDLISNDIEKLSAGNILYACLLNPQGKFLHDFFIHQGHDFLLLDCEGGQRAQDLFKRLNMYRLRAHIQISVEDHIPVYAGFGNIPPNAFADPRHQNMGWRSFEKPTSHKEGNFSDWDLRRISLCIPDGSRDLIPESSTLAEGRIDILNGVAYDKGCYIGQELTARMHYRGLAKKHLYTVEAINDAPLPAAGTNIEVDDRQIGEMRSSCGSVGIALIKDSEIENLSETGLQITKANQNGL